MVRKFSRPLLAASIVASLLGGCSGGGSPATPGIVASSPGSSTGAVAAQFPALASLPEVDSKNGSVSVTLTAQFDSSGRPAFYDNGVEAAPTIRVQPGDTIHLHFINALPQFCAVGVVSDSNLHFHGLTSAPVVPGDEVITTNASPGAAVDYTVAISADQPPGLYWYHPHPHGISSWEVGNGMAGAIVVEGIGNAVPQTAGLRERIIILGAVPNDVSLDAGEDAVGRRAQARRRARAAHRSTDDSDQGGNPCDADPETHVTINGAPQATIGIRPGETELFRVLNASGHRWFDFKVDGESVSLVAQDGVPVDTYPGAPPSIAMSDVVIPPAGRAEFLVTGQSHPVAIESQCYQTGPGGDPAPEAILGELADDGGAGASTNMQAHRVDLLPQGLRFSKYYHTSLPAPSASHTIHFEEDAGGFYLDNVRYDPAAPPAITAHSGTVEEWTLENDTAEVHDFHIHQVHFIVESVDGVAVQNPHWLDSLVLPPEGIGTAGAVHPSQTKVLIDFRDPVIKGVFLYHCHILDHEDGGMMAKIQVI